VICRIGRLARGLDILFAAHRLEFLPLAFTWRQGTRFLEPTGASEVSLCLRERGTGLCNLRLGPAEPRASRL
jgi:hypothetical protein